MQRAMDETNRRREIQIKYNQEHGIVPASIVKAVRDLTDSVRAAAEGKEKAPAGSKMPKDEVARLIRELEKQMKQAAQDLEFEKAALLRDQIIELRQEMEGDKLYEWERVRRS
jgi:excinuclease ABC subunit B